jgi:hypothetical protein
MKFFILLNLHLNKLVAIFVREVPVIPQGQNHAIIGHSNKTTLLVIYGSEQQQY